MGPTEKSFNQVKAILGKLDRSIDEVRARRTTGDHKAFPPVPPPTAAPLIAPPTRLSDAQSRQNSPYGRATPLPFGN